MKVDLLVVGCGITGAGIARDAARRGMSVVVADMGDMASGTSSRSSKLVHGGLRYLEQYEFSLVFESVSERRILMDLAPHLVNPLGFLFPVYADARKKLWLINAGMWLYDGLSLFRSPKIHKKLNAKEVSKVEPAIKRDGLKGAPLYYDCSTDDARLTLETLLDAKEGGAEVKTWTKVESFIKSPNGRVCGAMLKDAFSGEVKEIRADAVVNATGPWTDQTIAMSSGSRPPLLRPTKGIHIVVDHVHLPLSHAVVCFHPDDERVLFAIPWGEQTYIGTTDTDFEGDPADVYATTEDVDYLIDASNAYFPEFQIARVDVISTWAGLRPLMAPVGDENDLSESSVSREHQIVVGQDGLITIAGGKLTTYRRMAAEVVDTVERLLTMSGDVKRDWKASATAKLPLPGAVGWPDDDDHEKVAKQVLAASGDKLSIEQARHLGDTYGMRALKVAARVKKDETQLEPLVVGRQEIMGQVDWAVTEEFARTLTDVMVRRTQLYYRDADQGLQAAEKIADRMATLLDWSSEDLLGHLADYRDEVAASRRWRTTA